MSELTCTPNELRMRVKEFYELAPTATTHEELDQLMKMFGLSALNVVDDGKLPDAVAQVEAAAIWNIVSREYIKHLIRLDGKSLSQEQGNA